MLGAVVWASAIHSYTIHSYNNMKFNEDSASGAPPPTPSFEECGGGLHRQVVEPFRDSGEGCPQEKVKVSIYVQNEAVPRGALDSRADIYHAKMTHVARSNRTTRNWGGADGAGHPRDLGIVLRGRLAWICSLNVVQKEAGRKARVDWGDRRLGV